MAAVSRLATGAVALALAGGGEALSNEVEAYACALGTEPIAMPTPDPAPTGGDKTAPGAPGPIQVQPPGPSG